MQLDIRFPIGWLFTLLGLILTGYGLLSDATLYRRSLGHNVNLWWGLVMFAFGVLFVVLARRSARAAPPAVRE